MSTFDRRHVALRIPQDVLAQIDGLAKDRGLTRTAYMIRASTGDLGDPLEMRAEFDAVHRRIDRLEQLAFG